MSIDIFDYKIRKSRSQSGREIKQAQVGKRGGQWIVPRYWQIGQQDLPGNVAAHITLIYVVCADGNVHNNL